MIGFGKLFGLQDIYEGDEVRIQGGVDQAGSSSSVEVTDKNWQDQVDGVSDKWKDGVRKTVRFGGARRIHEERKDGKTWSRRPWRRCHCQYRYQQPM